MTDQADGLPPAARRVQSALDDLGLGARVVIVEDSARTAEEAAAAVGAELGQIVKSLVFPVDEELVLVLVSGANRLDPRKLATLAHGRVERADAEAVRVATGFAIGGIPPIAHARPLAVWCDADLLPTTRSGRRPARRTRSSRSRPPTWCASPTPRSRTSGYRVLRRGGCGSLRGDVHGQTEVGGASLGRPTRSLRSLKGYPSSVHDRSAPQRGRGAALSLGRQLSSRRETRGVRSGGQALRSFVAAGRARSR